MKMICDNYKKCKSFCLHKDIHEEVANCHEHCYKSRGITGSVCQPVKIEARKTPRKPKVKVSATRNKPNAEIFALLSKVKSVLYKNGLDETGDIVETVEQKLSAVR